MISEGATNSLFQMIHFDAVSGVVINSSPLVRALHSAVVAAVIRRNSQEYITCSLTRPQPKGASLNYAHLEMVEKFYQSCVHIRDVLSRKSTAKVFSNQHITEVVEASMLPRLLT